MMLKSKSRNTIQYNHVRYVRPLKQIVGLRGTFRYLEAPAASFV
jgi:hypothetical protein